MAVGARRCFREDAMTELTRRRIVAAAGATAAAGALAPFAPPAQAAAPLARSQAPGFYRCKVGEFEDTGAKLGLIDTGYGPGLGPTVGLLPATLAAAGFDPKAIDIVLISHLHGDH